MLIRIALIVIGVYLLYRFVIYKKKQAAKMTPPGRNRTSNSDISLTQQFQCYLTYDAPTNCILRDNRYYGENFKDKIPPALCVNCKCDYAQIRISSFDNFKEPNPDKKRQTDLGDLTPNEYRYYRAYLLSLRNDLDSGQIGHFTELTNQIDVSDAFKQTVNNYVLSHTRNN